MKKLMTYNVMGLIQTVLSWMIYVIHMVKSVYSSLQVINSQAPFLTINSIWFYDKLMTFYVLGLICIQTVWHSEGVPEWFML